MDVIEQVRQLYISGNVYSMNWLKRIKTEAGKPDAIGVLLLSDIIYWYRPTEVRDETTGKVIGYRKKFKADKLQRSYDQFAEQFGFSKSQVRRALKRLEKAGLITIEFRNVTTETGLKLANVMYVEPVPEKIKEITYTEKEIAPENKISNKTVHIYPNKFARGVSTNLSTPPHKNGDTNTKTTTCTTTVYNNNSTKEIYSNLESTNGKNLNEKNVVVFPENKRSKAEAIIIKEKEIMTTYKKLGATDCSVISELIGDEPSIANLERIKNALDYIKTKYFEKNKKVFNLPGLLKSAFEKGYKNQPIDPVYIRNERRLALEREKRKKERAKPKASPQAVKNGLKMLKDALLGNKIDFGKKLI